MHEDKYIRQRGLVDSKIFETPICLIGAGGIGSITGITLAKMGFKDISIWDGDRVELHNLANTFYQRTAINFTKSVALHFAMYSHNKEVKINMNSFWTKQKLAGLVISTVDRMSVRKEIFKHVLKNNKVTGFIDARMARQNAEIYTIDPINKDDVQFYNSKLWDSEEIEFVPCTEKAIIYNTVWCGSMICNQARLLLQKMIYQKGIGYDFDNAEQYNLSQVNVYRTKEGKVMYGSVPTLQGK